MAKKEKKIELSVDQLQIQKIIKSLEDSKKDQQGSESMIKKIDNQILMYKKL